MDVTPGPQLRRQITVLDEMLRNYDRECAEWSSNDDLPAPDWRSWAEGFRAEIRIVLPLVRS